MSANMQMEELNHLTNKTVISSPQEEKSLDECIQNIIKKEGYITYEIKKKQLQQDGGNYMGVLYEVDVKGKTKQEQKTTAIFIKTMPANDGEIGVSLQDIYNTEKLLYYEISNIFDKLQKEAAIPEEKRYKMVKTYNETHPEALFLENMTRKGFRTWFRMDVATLDYAEECVKALARFHGISFALEKKQPDYFNEVIKPLVYGTKPGKAHDELLESVVATVKDTLDCCVRSKIEDDMRPIMKKFLEFVLRKDSVCCLCHGDYRPNNIMHKTVKGRVTEVVPVDYQFAYYGCPVLDFLYFIYLSTDHQFRKDHLPYLKDLYHETLTEFLNYFNLSVDLIFPRQQFDELYEKKKIFGLSVTMFLGPFIFTDEDKIIELKDAKDPSKIVLDDRFKDRLYDAIKEFYDI